MINILLYFVAAGLAAFLVWIDLRLFALYSFMVTIYMIGHGIEVLSALIRTAHSSNAMKIIAVAKKLGVSGEDFDQVAKVASASVGPTLRRDLEKYGVGAEAVWEDEDPAATDR